jgi:hypothetical protein
MAQTAIGHFRDRASADAAYEDLIASGFPKDDISLISPGREAGGLADDDGLITAGDGVKIGGVGGLLLGAAAMLIPGIGPIVAVGPIAAGLAGAVTGGVTGAVLGGVAAGLIHAGLSEDEATYYDERLRHGGYLITVHTDDVSFDKARMVLERRGADMHGQSSTTRDVTTEEGTAAPASDDLSRFGTVNQAASDPTT